jgi:hypothetical protein
MGGASSGGWWLAADGRWYPPESHPNRRCDREALAWQAAQRATPPHAQLPQASPPSDVPARPQKPNEPVVRARISALQVLLTGIAVLAVAAVVLVAVSFRSDRVEMSVGRSPESGTSSTPARVGARGAGTPATTERAPSVSTSTTVTPPLVPTEHLPQPYTGSGPPGDLVTSQVEATVVRDTWAGFLDAILDNDWTDLARYASVYAQRTEEATLYCGCSPPPPTYSGVAFSAPIQSSYPASFLAQFITTGYNQHQLVELVTFIQASARAPWLVASYSSWRGTGFLTTGVHLTGTVVPEATLATAPAAYARFFQALDTTGKPPSTAPTGFVTDHILQQEIAEVETSFAAITAEGEKVSTTHSVVEVGQPFSVWTTPNQAHGPGEIETFVIRVTTTTDASAGKQLVQTTQRAAWTALLAPGWYSQIVETQDFEVAVYEGAASGECSVLAITGGPFAFRGTSS